MKRIAIFPGPPNARHISSQSKIDVNLGGFASVSCVVVFFVVFELLRGFRGLRGLIGLGVFRGLLFGCGPRPRWVPMRTIHVNGAASAFQDGESVADLIRRLALDAPRVAVEINRTLVPRARWAEVRLQDGDRVEVVQFVGGGA
jgi:sulfur carrier protein